MLALRIPAARFTVDLAPVLRVSCLSWLLIDRCRWFLFGRLFIVGCLTLLSCHAMTDGSSVPCFSSDLLASQGYEPLSGKHEVLYRGDLPWEVRGGGTRAHTETHDLETQPQDFSFVSKLPGGVVPYDDIRCDALARTSTKRVDDLASKSLCLDVLVVKVSFWHPCNL